MSYLPNVITSPAQGDILYFDGSKFVNLGHGTSGQVLITQGASANPAWSSTPTLGALTLGGNLTLSTHNIVTDAVTGTKIGTATSQLLGFYNANPVAQQTNGTAADLAAIADAPAKAFVTALSTALVNLGLLAAPA